MPLIERFTQGGNLYPDGNSEFAMLLQAFRRIAENRDVRDTEIRNTANAAASVSASALTQAGQAERNAISAASLDATTKANTAREAATTAAAADATAKATAAHDQAVATAQSYTDASFAASGPGGATDAQVDAAVERAVLAQRIGSVTLTQVALGVYEFTTV